MERTITVILSADERAALQALADQDLRYPEHQLRALVREAAAARGLWPPKNRTKTQPPARRDTAQPAGA